MLAAAATEVFEALSSPLRLDTFRLLVKHEPTGLVAGEIATLVGISPANLSFHLKTLSRAGLVSVAAEGRFQRYRAELGMVEELVRFLTAECCHGNAALCGELVPSAAGASAAAPPRRTAER